MTYRNQWPAGSNSQTTKPVSVCPKQGCGAHYTGDSHVCRTTGGSR